MVQAEIYQFLEAKDLLRVEAVSKKVSVAARQDFIWRYLTQNTVRLSRAKLFNDTWKKHFLRNFAASKHMTPESFNYLMCPIRTFKEVVRHIDAYMNFVFAADVKGNVLIALIDENDLENDDESMQIQTLSFPQEVEYMAHQIYGGQLQLVIVTGLAEVIILNVEQTGPKSFGHELSSQVQLPMTTPSNLYVCRVNEQILFVSNYCLDGNDFMKDQTITLYNTYSQQIVYTQKLELDLENTNARLVNALTAYHQLRVFNPVLNARRFLEQFKGERSKQRLAAYDGTMITIALFNGSLLQVNTKMTELQLFMARTNIRVVEGDGLFTDLRHHKGILIALDFPNIKTYAYTTLEPVATYNIGGQLGPVVSITIDSARDILYMVKTDDLSIEMLTIQINTAEKKLVEPFAQLQDQEKNKINDIEMGANHFVSATAEGGVKFRIFKNNTLAQFIKPFFINASSKTVKTYKSHPYKEGVSMVKGTQNKVIVVLGNVIRVYSFDFVK